MSLKTACEKAQMYETAINKLVEGTVQSYSIGGQSYTRLQLESLERLARYWRKECMRSRYGFVSYINNGSTGQQ